MLIATRTAVYDVMPSAGSDSPTLRLDGQEVQCLAEGSGVGVISLAGGDLVLLSPDGSHRIPTGIQEPVESLLIVNESPLGLLLGTEAPHLYTSGGEGRGTTRIASFGALECRESWHTPWGGPASVRCLAGTRDGWVYADIHVGSIMRSPDKGASWEPVTPDLHEDVHQVATCPRADDRIYANTANAVYVSEDRGRTWQHRSGGLSARYGRAIAVHPLDPDCLLASVSDGPSRANVHGKLYRTEDAGQTWTHVTDGFPASASGNIDTFHVAFSSDGTAWAVVNRTLYASHDRGVRWEPFFESPEPIAMISCRV